jgi:hypothetical protein
VKQKNRDEAGHEPGNNLTQNRIFLRCGGSKTGFHFSSFR